MYFCFVFLKNKRIREVYVKRFTVLSRGRVNKNKVLEYKVKESKENFYDLNSKWPLEGILNTFSGKTKMVEKVLENEKYESNTVRLLNKL